MSSEVIRKEKLEKQVGYFKVICLMIHTKVALLFMKTVFCGLKHPKGNQLKDILFRNLS